MDILREALFPNIEGLQGQVSVKVESSKKYQCFKNSMKKYEVKKTADGHGFS